MRPTPSRFGWIGALALAGTLAAGNAQADYKLHFGWSPRPHFPAPLIDPSPKPNTWVFKTRFSPELEVRRGNWEMRIMWERVDQQEWNFPRLLQQMLRLGCDIVEPTKARDLIERLYATRSLVPPRDPGDGLGPNILHRLTVLDTGCVIALEARGRQMHMLKVVVSPPPPRRRPQ
jgi:hypothetical protein